MNWYNHKKNERHSVMTPGEHRDILLKPWRNMTIILGAEVRRMVSVVPLFKFSWWNALSFRESTQKNIYATRVVIGQFSLGSSINSGLGVKDFRTFIILVINRDPKMYANRVVIGQFS